MAMTKNVRRFLAAVHALQDRPPGLEGMGLLWGLAGEGKTTTLAFVSNQLDGVYVRAQSSWTVSSMLADICHELGLPPRRIRAQAVRDIIQVMIQGDRGPRPLFIDEAGYLLDDPKQLDTIRDIYDMVPGAAVILVGEENLARKVKQNGRFARRVTQWVEFTGIDIHDARTVAETVCEVGIAADLLAYMHQETHGNIGRQVVALAKIESAARAAGLATMDRAAWGDRPLYLDQPEFKRRKK
jgi:hypothetical protein